MLGGGPGGRAGDIMAASSPPATGPPAGPGAGAPSPDHSCEPLARLLLKTRGEGVPAGTHPKGGVGAVTPPPQGFDPFGRGVNDACKRTACGRSRDQ